MPDAPDPLVEAAAAVYALLSADPGLVPTEPALVDPDINLAPGGVWEAKAATEIPGYPAVVYNVAPIGTDNTMTGPWRHRLSLALTIVDKADNIDRAARAAARVYTLLQDQDIAIKAADGGLAMPNFDVLLCRRRLRNRVQTVVEGETFQQLVEQYDYQVRPV